MSFFLHLNLRALLTIVTVVLGLGGATYPLIPKGMILWFLISVIAAFFILYLIHLVVSRNELQERASYNQELLQRYTDAIIERLNSFWRVHSWDKSVVILPNGDAKETTVVEASAVGQDLTFYRVWAGAGRRQPMTYAAKSRTQVHVRGPILADGSGGVERDVTYSWMRNGQLEILVHFASPIKANQRFALVFDVFWPSKCERFMKRGQPDEFKFKVTHQLEKFKYAVEMPPGCDVLYDAIGFDMGSNKDSAIRREFDEKKNVSKVVVELGNLGENENVGMTLQLK
ncbi:hypothetical protein AB0J40_33840 [Amycolatopsis sp. NPDC049691]|uniref:hypothetical protein n=1 Tax=Amycolatopsis sp. NPDC049691 TaxID=3155155 RepID=UPI00341D8CBC